MNKPVVFLKSHVESFTRKDGVVVQAHDTKVTAHAPVPDTKTQNEGRGFHGAAMDSHRYEKHGPDGDAGSEAEHREQYKAGDHAFSNAAHALVGAGHFDNHDQARDYLDSTHGRHLGDEVGHKGDATKPKWLAGSVKAFKKDNPPASAGVHHGDLREGDEIEGPNGEKHEFSHSEQGIGRKVVHTAAGHTLPTERDGTLKGFKKTGTNFADPAPARQRRGSAPIQQKGAPPVEGIEQKTPAEKVAAKRAELAARKPAAAAKPAKTKVQNQGEDIGAGSWSKGHRVKIHAPGHELHGNEGVITSGDAKAPGRVVIRHDDGTGHSVHGSDLRPAAGHSWPQ